MVNSKEHRVVVIESILCPTNFRNTLAKVLFNHLNVRLEFSLFESNSIPETYAK